SQRCVLLFAAATDSTNVTAPHASPASHAARGRSYGASTSIRKAPLISPRFWSPRVARPDPANAGAIALARTWHRLFGLMLSTHVKGSSSRVETERDLSKRRQLLDVLVVRRGPGEPLWPMPDGLDDFVDHNLLTFKSFREALDDWTLKELTGHYVNYRKE